MRISELGVPSCSWSERLICTGVWPSLAQGLTTSRPTVPRAPVIAMFILDEFVLVKSGLMGLMDDMELIVVGLAQLDKAIERVLLL